MIVIDPGYCWAAFPMEYRMIGVSGPPRLFLTRAVNPLTRLGSRFRSGFDPVSMLASERGPITRVIAMRGPP